MEPCDATGSFGNATPTVNKTHSSLGCPASVTDGQRASSADGKQVPPTADGATTAVDGKDESGRVCPLRTTMAQEVAKAGATNRATKQATRSANRLGKCFGCGKRGHRTP